MVGFTGEFLQTFTEDKTLILYELFQEIEKILPKLFYRAGITLTPKSDKEIANKDMTDQYSS